MIVIFFMYTASHLCTPDRRVLELNFVCDQTADPYDDQTLSCGEYTPICDYWFTVYTKLACLNQSGNDGSDELSTGSIILIVVFVGITVYCVGGFIFNGWRNPKEEAKWTDFSYNIPNLPFWKLLLQLVIAGCAETTDWIKGKIVERDGKPRHNTYSQLEEDVASTSEYQ